MVHIVITNFNNNPNLGLYAYVNDKAGLIGSDISDERMKELKVMFGVDMHRITICGTSLPGIFICGNSKKILVPAIAFDREIKILEKLGFEVGVIETKLTALGNNILCNDHGAIVNPEFEDEAVEQIKMHLGVPVIKGKIAELNIVGSLAVLNSKGFCLVHHEIETFEKKFIEKHLKVKCYEGTVNMGSPYVKSGVLTNKNGFAIGSISGGPEIDNADRALGFIDN